MIKENKWCVTCKSTENLTRHNKATLKNGDTVLYFICVDDARKRRIKYKNPIQPVFNGKTIDREWCVKCKRKELLMKYTSRLNNEGTKVQYYLCNPCNAEKRMKWYYNGNQQKAMEINRRYLRNK